MQPTPSQTRQPAATKAEEENMSQGQRLEVWRWRFFTALDMLVEHPLFNRLMVFTLVINTISIVARAADAVELRAGWHLDVLECLFLAIYINECGLKLLAWGRLYFTNPWNNIDFILLVVALLDLSLKRIGSLGGSDEGPPSEITQALKTMRVFRALRVCRGLRLVRHVSSLEAVMRAAVQSVRATLGVAVYMIVVHYMFAVIFTGLFRESDPQHFGSLFRSMFTLFQVLTLDDWTSIYYTSKNNGAPHIIIFLVLYIVIQCFVFLNLSIALVVDEYWHIRASQIQKNSQKDDNKEQETEPQNKEPQSEQQVLEETLRQTYGDTEEGKRKTQLISRYLTLLAEIEETTEEYRSQAALLDLLVDSFVEAPEEEVLGSDDN